MSKSLKSGDSFKRNTVKQRNIGDDINVVEIDPGSRHNESNCCNCLFHSQT